jgi:hypothetical protein
MARTTPTPPAGGAAQEPKSLLEQRGAKLDADVSKPQVTLAGYAPADTLDPTERATSVTADKASAGKAGFGSVNAVTVLPEPERPRQVAEDQKERTETYEQPGPDGKLVRVTHNLDTGETTRD